MKSVPSLLFFRPMKKEPTVFPFGPIAEMIVVPKRPYRPGEKCLDKSTGEVVTILSCEPMKVSEVTKADMIAMGIDASPRRWWGQKFQGKKWCWRVEGKEHADDIKCIDALVAQGHTRHCACRQVWGDGECSCALERRTK